MATEWRENSLGGWASGWRSSPLEAEAGGSTPTTIWMACAWTMVKCGAGQWDRLWLGSVGVWDPRVSHDGLLHASGQPLPCPLIPSLQFLRCSCSEDRCQEGRHVTVWARGGLQPIRPPLTSPCSTVSLFAPWEPHQQMRVWMTG